MRRNRAVLIVKVLLVLSLLVGTTVALAAPAEQANRTPDELDVLFVGAHPDDEALTLGAFGQWGEYDGARAGVVTITRGEGGGNAVGTEEGPDLGRLREAEERRAVGFADIVDIIYLDKVDFYYNVSGPLTELFWNHDDTLERVVRIIRESRPKILTTMNPSPTPGNHGNHQYAARMAVEAYHAAGDPDRFPQHITEEGLEPWEPSRVFLGGAGLITPGAVFNGEGLPVGDGSCTGAEPPPIVFTVPGSRFSQKHGRPWGLVLADAASQYASQGWSSPAFTALITALGTALCNNFIQVDSRVPFTVDSDEPNAPLEGATFPAAGGFPLGTQFALDVDPFHIVPGETMEVTAWARDETGDPMTGAEVDLVLPTGFTASGDGSLATVGARGVATFAVTAPADATPGQVRLGAVLTGAPGTASTTRLIEVVPAVRGTMQPLPHVAEFRDWARTVGAPQLDSLIVDRQAIRVGGAREIGIDIENFSDVAQSGTVNVTVPAGFTIAPASTDYSGLAPGARDRLTFTVTNTDDSLATSDDGGDYAVDIAVSSSTGDHSIGAALNLVPGTVIPEAAAAPVLDGLAGPGEYTGEVLDLSRQWEGTAPAVGPMDASGSAQVTWFEDDLYIFVDVVDQAKGNVLPPDDCKRHWRTDSVEIAIDPTGSSENTSSTFKAGIFPETADPDNGNGPCWQRDADNNQGPGEITAPGMEVASTVSSPYTGYTLEARIALADLPGPIDPDNLGLNVLIYDSDTQDNTGQRRLGWSTWGGVQGDPYRWGRASLPGYTPPAGRSVVAPNLDFPALFSLKSPQTIHQSSRNGIAAGGLEQAGDGVLARIESGPNYVDDTISVQVTTLASGTLWLYAWNEPDERFWLHADEVDVERGTHVLHYPLDGDAAAALDDESWLLVAFQNTAGGTRSISKQFSFEAFQEVEVNLPALDGPPVTDNGGAPLPTTGGGALTMLFGLTMLGALALMHRRTVR